MKNLFNKCKEHSLRTKKSFQGTLNLSLNQYRCPKCFSTLEAQVHSGTSTLFRYKSLDYYWIEERATGEAAWHASLSPVKIVLNIKICPGDDLAIPKRAIYSRSRAKIYDHYNVLRKKKFIYSTVKPFLICKKCKYTRQLPFFVKPDSQGQLFKNML